MLNWGKVDPALLDTAFRADVEQFLGQSPYGWGATYGLRSFELQDALYRIHLAGGPTAAPPGRSAHNYGLAIDVTLDGDPKKPGIQPNWGTTHVGWLWLKAQSIVHPRLRTGWKYADYGHIEAVNWKVKAKELGY